MLAHCRLTKAPKLSPKSLQKYPELLLNTPKYPWIAFAQLGQPLQACAASVRLTSPAIVKAAHARYKITPDATF